MTRYSSIFADINEAFHMSISKGTVEIIDEILWYATIIVAGNWTMARQYGKKGKRGHPTRSTRKVVMWRENRLDVIIFSYFLNQIPSDIRESDLGITLSLNASSFHCKLCDLGRSQYKCKIQRWRIEPYMHNFRISAWKSTLPSTISQIWKKPMPESLNPTEQISPNNTEFSLVGNLSLSQGGLPDEGRLRRNSERARQTSHAWRYDVVGEPCSVFARGIRKMIIIFKCAQLVPLTSELLSV